jgi:hypothetical protein
MNKNAADESQVRKAGERERRGRELEIADLAHLLKQPEGRRFLQRLIEVCGVSNSVWHASALIHYRSGAQDVGHHIIKLILEANPTVGAAMLAESYNEKGEQE